jgi:serine/threonine protein kinase
MVTNPVLLSLKYDRAAGAASLTLTAVVVHEDQLFPQFAGPAAAVQRRLIRELVGLEEVRELGASRFGAVRLLRRRKADGEPDIFAGKFYNAGDNGEGLQAFQDRVQPLIELSHPHVMPIVGVISPTKGVGPIILTSYSELGSLANVLDQVCRNDAPRIWNDSTKLRMIVSLVSGLSYLHNHGIVHLELKPRDLIVCGYATSILEEHKFTRASQVGGPSYIAPEIYEDRPDGVKARDPKTDVFSFGLILYELLCGVKMFPLSMSAAVIMRRAMNGRPSDRPTIPDGLHPVLRDMIRCS